MERGRPRPQKYAPVNATISKLAEHRYCCTPRKTSEQFCSPVGAAARMAAPNLPKGVESKVVRAVHCAPVWVMLTQVLGPESCRPRPYGRGYV